MQKTTLCVLSLLTFYTSCNSSQSLEVQPVRKNITETVFASGVLEPDNKYNLTAQTDGYLLSLAFEEGSQIAPNQVLAVIDNKNNVANSIGAAEQLRIAQLNASANAPALKQMEASILTAKDKLRRDEVQLARYEALIKDKSVSQAEYDNMKLTAETSRNTVVQLQAQYDALKLQAEQQLVTQKTLAEVNSINSTYNTIRAIVGGKVYKKMKQIGDFVRRGDVIAVIGNPQQIYAKLNIDENSIAKVKVGQEVVIQLNTQKNKTYKGQVYEILPSFEEATQSFICKVSFKDSLDFTIIGTQLEGNIVIGEKKNVLLIPRTYLGYGNKVQLKNIDTITTIQTGIISTEWVEVLSGLAEKDVIVPLQPKKK
jgi:multidrug efflux pump subunit AcrA (membrane-fusion protein)